MEEDHLISTLQVTLAATRAEAHRQRQRRRQRFMDQLLQLEPLERLKRTVWLQAHGSPRYSKLLSQVDVAYVQEAAIRYIRNAVDQVQEPAERFMYVRCILLDLDLMQDHDDVVHGVRQKVVLILD